MPQQRQRTVGKVAVVAFKSWGPKRTEIYIELTFHSHFPTPLLPAPTLSEGEYKVSSSELEVSGRGEPASQSTRSSFEAQNGL
jgi:hypothetical protein